MKELRVKDAQIEQAGYGFNDERAELNIGDNTDIMLALHKKTNDSYDLVAIINSYKNDEQSLKEAYEFAAESGQMLDHTKSKMHMMVWAGEPVRKFTEKELDSMIAKKRVMDGNYHPDHHETLWDNIQ